MENKYKFEIQGEPQAQKRHRNTTKGGATWSYDPSAKDKEIVRQELLILPNKPFFATEKLEITIHACFTIPKSYSAKKRDLLDGTYRNKKPDNDNVEKFYFDLMTGILYEDDRQIVINHTYKFYSKKPRVEIIIHTISDEKNNG